MKKKRNKLEIVYDIMRAIMDQKNRVRPTQILYKSNLSHKMLVEYINELVGKGLIEEVEEDKKRYYCLTKKGFRFIEDYEKVKAFMECYGIE